MMWAEQKRRVWFFSISVLQIMSWVSVASRPSPHEAQGQSSHSLQVQWQPKQQGSFGKREEVIVPEEAFKGFKTIGSRPPSCVHKCGRCHPCEAMQVPTIPDRVDLQYANYVPESWKCRCGTSFFNP